MTRFTLLAVCVLAVGCGKDSKGTSSGGSGAAVGTSSSAAPPSGDCKSVAICDVLPSAHVDELCGTKTTKTLVDHVASKDTMDGCSYQIPNGAADLMIGRTCMSKASGGADMVKQMFDLQREDSKKNNEVTEMPGIGDAAYYSKNRNSAQNATLFVRKGNVLFTIQHDSLTKETEDAIKTKCMIALYNELAAK